MSEQEQAEEKCKKVKVKMSRTVSSGYRCGYCHVRTVVYDAEGVPHVPPAKCLACHTSDPVLEFRDLIENTTRVETIKL